MSLVLGVDGGNTKTIALAAQLDGAILGSGRGGPGDIYVRPSPDTALNSVDAAVTAALAMAGISRDGLSVACFSMAGADWTEDFELLYSAMRARGYGARIIVVNDAIGALFAGAPGGPAVSVVCGTGAATGSRGAGGQVWHSSFWQHTQGAFHMGQKVLQAVYGAELGLEPPTALSARVLELYQLPTVEAVLHYYTARDSRPTIHTKHLARLLLDTAAAGDPTAQRIVCEHGAGLGDYALAAARRVGILDVPFALVLAGGVLRHPAPLLREAITHRVQASAPHARPVIPRFEPAAGAIIIALEAAGVAIGDAVLARMSETMPAAALFET